MYKKQLRLKAIRLLDQIILPFLLWGLVLLLLLSITVDALNRIYTKRRRLTLLHFVEQIVLPFITTILILLLALAIAVGVFGVKFSSMIQMMSILGLIIFVLGGLLFEISRQLIKQLLKK